MTPDELKKLQKDVKRTKRIASEWASQLHDLVEDRLPAAYEEIPSMSQSTFAACLAWKEATARLQSAEAEMASALTAEGAAS